MLQKTQDEVLHTGSARDAVPRKRPRVSGARQRFLRAKCVASSYPKRTLRVRNSLSAQKAVLLCFDARTKKNRKEPIFA